MANSSIAYRSSISIGGISKSISNLSSSVANTQKTAIKMTSVLSNSNRRKSTQLSRITTIFQKRQEAVRRREQEDIVEASSISAPLKRSGSIISSSTKGFLGRIFDFVGTLMVGWLINNLPSIISSSQALSTRVKKLTAILSFGISDMRNILVGFGGVLKGIYSNIVRFDFTDSEKRVSTSFNTMNDGLEEVRIAVFNVINLFSGDLNKLFGFDIPKIDVPEIPVPSEDGQLPSPIRQDGGGLPDPKSAEMYRIAAALTTEGISGQSAVDIMQVVVNRKASGRYGSNYTDILAAGQSVNRSQFQGVWKRPGGPREFRKIQTLQDAARWSGQSQATLLGVISDIQDPAKQASAAKHVKGALEFRAAPQYYLEKGLVRGMGPDGRFYNSSWRGSAGDNQFLQQSGKDPMLPGPASFNLPSAQPQTQPVSKPTAPLVTNLISVSGTSGEGLGKKPLSVPVSPFMSGSSGGAIITSGIGMRWLRGKQRQHTGYDIAANPGTPLHAYLPGEVTHIGLDGTSSSAGYGNWAVWKDSVYGSYHFFGHMLQRPSVKVGDQINQGTLIGKVGSTGESTGPHLHWEISNSPPQSNGQFTSYEDPGSWLRKHPITNAPSVQTRPTQAQINIESARKDTTSLKTDKKGDIITVPLPQQDQSSTVPIIMNQGSTIIPSGGKDIKTFITQKLLLDLAYT